MARVPTVDPTDFPPDLFEAVGSPSADDRVQLGALTAWANRPELALAVVRFQHVLERESMLPARLRELVRLRVAFHNRCRSCMAVRSAAAIADGMTDGAVCSLERPSEASDLTDAEKAALRYADLMATDHLAVDDAVFEQLRAYFDERQIVELGVHIGFCVGFGRLSATWDLVDDLPDDYRGTDPVPWSAAFTTR